MTFFIQKCSALQNSEQHVKHKHMNNPTSLTHATSLTVQLVLCALAVVSLLYLPLPILPLLAETYQLSPVQSGYTLGAFGFAYASGFMIFGPLSDRVGRKPVMVGGLLALALITLGLAAVRAPNLFLLGRALQGFAAASFPPVALSYLAERGTQRQRVWGVAWMSTAFLSAGLLGQIYGGVMASHWGFSAALLPLSLIYAVTAVRMNRVNDETKRVRTHTVSLWSSYQPIGNLLANPLLRRVYGPAFLLLMCFVAFYVSLDAHLGPTMERQGISPLAARGLALPAFLAPLAVAVYIPRWGAHRITSAGLMVAALGLLLGAAAGADHLVLLLGASVVFVGGVGISVPGLISRVADLTEAPVRGLAVSFYTFVLFVGASLGPWLAALGSNMSEEAFLLVLAGLMAIAAVYSAVGQRVMTHSD